MSDQRDVNHNALEAIIAIALTALEHAQQKALIEALTKRLRELQQEKDGQPASPHDEPAATKKE